MRPTGPRTLVPLVAITACVCAAVFAAVFWRDRARQALQAGVLSAAPPGTWLLVTVNVTAGAPLVQPLLGTDGGLAGVSRVAGLGSISEACGFEPLAHVAEAMLVVPEGGGHGDFGAAFAGDLTKQQLLTCADKSIRARGGEPVTTTRGRYTIVSDGRAPDQGSLAFRDGGPFLAAQGAWLDAMIYAADGTGPRLGLEHSVLRDGLTAVASSGAPALLATAIFPRSVRDRLRGELDGGPGQTSAFAGVLAVDRAGVAVSVGAASTELRAILHCDGLDAAAACAQVKTLIERERFALSRNLGLRVLGIGPLVDGLTADVQGSTLSVLTKAPTADAAKLLARVVERTHTPGPWAPVVDANAGAPFDAGADDRAQWDPSRHAP